MEPGVNATVRAAIKTLEEAGAEIVDVTLPHTDYGLAAYYIIAPAECSSMLARFDGVQYGLSVQDVDNITEMYMRTRRQGFGTEVRRRIMLGTYALSSGYYDAYYLKAKKVRTLIKRDFDEAFSKCDAIVGATSPIVAFPIGSKTADPLSMYLCDVLTLGGNLAGLPGISLPCGTSEGLPVGLQVLAPQWREDVALRGARAYEVAVGVKAEAASPPSPPGGGGGGGEKGRARRGGKGKGGPGRRQAAQGVGVVRRPESCRRAADGDRDRAGHPIGGRGPGLRAGAKDAAADDRRVGGRDGKRSAAG